MTRRGLIRLFAVTTVSLLMVVAGAFAWTAAASAHVVTGIEADCTHVTVSFADFPRSGVMVHIAVTVEGHAPLTTDVLVKRRSGPVSLDISSVTSDLFGATANVDVDVTWTFEGPQHVEQTLQVTCGETTSTALGSSSSTASTTSTTGVGATSSSTDTSATTSSTVESGNSSTTDTGASSTTASTSLGPVGGGGGGSTSSTGPGGEATAGAIRVAGESISAPGNTVASAAAGAGQSGSLPFTGLATVPLVVLGVAALTAGAAAISGARRRRMTNP